MVSNVCLFVCCFSVLAGENAQQLKVLVSLLQGPSSLPNTYVGCLKTASHFGTSGSDSLSWLLQILALTYTGPYTDAHTDT